MKPANHSTDPITDARYWEQRYLDHHTPWDIGQASPALLHYARQFDKDARILIPGAGRAYEAIALHREGYREVYVCDWAPSAFNWLRQNGPEFPEAQMLVGDFFALEGTWDLLLEQTFFCALRPERRENYARKARKLLQADGMICGLLFGVEFDRTGPPFGGSAQDYKEVFEPHFEVITMEPSQRSISPRMGSELEIQLRARQII